MRPIQTPFLCLFLLFTTLAHADPLAATAFRASSEALPQLYAQVTANPGDAGLSKSLWVAAQLKGSNTLFVRGPAGWAAWDGAAPPAPLLASTDDQLLLDLLGGSIDASLLNQAQVYVGFGRDWADMLGKGNYATVYSAPVMQASINRYVASSGNDAAAGTLDQPWRTIQRAVDSAAPGTTIYVRGGVYGERVTLGKSGTAGGEISLRAYPGEVPILDGSTLSALAGTTALLTLDRASHVSISGFELRNYRSNTAGAVVAGILVQGSGSQIALRDNHVHQIQTTVASSSGNAFGLVVYGSEAPASIKQLVIDGNELDSLSTGSSESMAINGNVQYFAVTGNKVHDNNNIGIDIIGYEGTAPQAAFDRARDGVLSGNTVYNISSLANPAYKAYSAGGIYVDGGTRILIEGNTIRAADIGIEVASEHKGTASDFVTVRNNLIYQNNTVGISIGGYSASVGGTSRCTIVNNTLYQNDTSGSGSGEFAIAFNASGNVFKNNLLSASAQGVLLSQATSYAQAPVSMDGNLYFSSGSPSWRWNGKTLTSLAALQAASQGDAQSLFANPQLIDPAASNFTPSPQSPAVNRGLDLGAAVTGSSDWRGQPRRIGPAIDIGAIEQ
ncbi:DUF1565 domain-containing protein [Chitinimonas sp.]|uniref:DUF1565 domain-containing protein n=1 Tax=Chitinimonas sp. TaxID=1934313 RepID=UPI0035B36EC0